MIENPIHVRIRMFGIKRLEDPETTLPILDIFEESPLMVPEFWSLDERTKLPYDRQEIEQHLNNTRPLAIDDIFLKRRRKAKYVGRLKEGPRPHIDFEFDGKLNPKSWGDVFAFSDQLAKLFQPDFAVTHIAAHPLNSPRPDDYESKVDQSGYVTNITPGKYKKFGPLGLGMRTYIGDYYQNQIGRDLLLATPGCVIDEDTYGMRLDLAEEPWTLDVEEMCDRWETATNHLNQAKVFPTITATTRVRAAKGENCVIRPPL